MNDKLKIGEATIDAAAVEAMRDAAMLAIGEGRKVVEMDVPMVLLVASILKEDHNIKAGNAYSNEFYLTD
jgi:hypothetical protein